MTFEIFFMIIKVLLIISEQFIQVSSTNNFEVII